MKEMVRALFINVTVFLAHRLKRKKKKKATRLVDNLVMSKCICIRYLVHVPVRMHATQGAPIVLFPVTP